MSELGKLRLGREPRAGLDHLDGFHRQPCPLRQVMLAESSLPAQIGELDPDVAKRAPTFDVLGQGLVGSLRCGLVHGVLHLLWTHLTRNESATAVCYGRATSQTETTRLLLRPWQVDDLSEFTRLLTDPEVTRYIVVHTPFSPKDVAELSERTLEQWERNGFGPWAAIEKATGRWVGRIGLDELPDWPGPDKVEVGWELHREFWGPGVATEGGRAGVCYGFEAVGLERIINATMATNAASRRVIEKCGLRFQGELAMAGTVVAWYAIDRADWQASQAAAGR